MRTPSFTGPETPRENDPDPFSKDVAEDGKIPEENVTTKVKLGSS